MSAPLRIHQDGPEGDAAKSGAGESSRPGETHRDAIPFPTGAEGDAGAAQSPIAWEPPTDSIRNVEQTWEHVERQVRNLRALLGESGDSGDGPRAA